jgi:hypothetical protein
MVLKPLDQESNSLLQLVDALPQQITFYHLGEVILQGSQNQDLADLDSQGVLYKFSGDFNAVLILLFARDLDISMYSELGNIIASQIVQQLSGAKDLDLMISPPQLLKEGQLKRITQNNPTFVQRTYGHFYKNSVIPVEALVMPAPTEEIRHA